MVSVRKASLTDSTSIAALHLTLLPEALLTSMGPAFVIAFYRTLLDSRLGFGFLAEAGGRPIGYATGILDWRRFSRVFVLRNLRVTAGVLIRLAFGLRRWGRLAETTRYAVESELPNAELVSIAVEPEARGTGTADALVRHVLDEFARRGVRRVRVTTASDNAAAARIYERSGFHLLGETEIHRGEVARLYVIALGEGARCSSPTPAAVP